MKAAEEMTREELIAYDKWLTRRKWGTGEIISPEKAADLYLAEQPLPPAEGATAEEFLKGCEHDGSFIPVHEVIRLMNAFAASQKQQPTAEGAEEILDGFNFMDLGEPIQTGEFYYRSEVLEAMNKFATLHAQRIADKMVSERYEIAIKALETIHHAYYTEGESAEEQVVDLRSIALKALEEIDNLKTR